MVWFRRWCNIVEEKTVVDSVVTVEGWDVVASTEVGDERYVVDNLGSNSEVAGAVADC